MNQPFAVAGEYAACASDAESRKKAASEAVARRRRLMGTSWRSDEVGEREVYELIGAVGRTRTGMGYPIRPSNVRVYQFHHDGTLRLRGTSRGIGGGRRRSGRRRSGRRAGRGLPRDRNTAGGPRERRRSFLRRRPLRQRLDDRRARPRFEHRQQEREHDEAYERSGRQLVKDRRRAARPESGLASSASESAGDVRTLPLLEEHHQDEEEADEYV